MKKEEKQHNKMIGAGIMALAVGYMATCGGLTFHFENKANDLQDEAQILIDDAVSKFLEEEPTYVNNTQEEIVTQIENGNNIELQNMVAKSKVLKESFLKFDRKSKNSFICFGLGIFSAAIFSSVGIMMIYYYGSQYDRRKLEQSSKDGLSQLVLTQNSGNDKTIIETFERVEQIAPNLDVRKILEKTNNH